jgi:hypothetical protein
MNKLAAYKKMVPQIEIFADNKGRWRYRFGFLTKKGRKTIFDCLLTSSESYTTSDEAEAMARFVICNAWTVTETTPL